MTDTAQELKREHHLYVSVAKFLFLHKKYGVVTVRDPIKLNDAKKRELKPIILYGITVAGLSIRYMTFSSLTKPKSINAFLHEEWTHSEGLRGQPDTLKISRNLAAACPALAADMTKIGVELKIATADEKALPASMRAAQDSCLSISNLTRRWPPNPVSDADAISALCKEAQAYNSLHCLIGQSNANPIRQWLSLPKKQTSITQNEKIDWKPGPWLSSWEASLPPDRPRYFRTDAQDGGTWLLLGQDESQELDEDDELWFAPEDNMAEIAKNLVACWPNPPAAIAASAGIATRQLQWFTAGKAELDQSERYQLQNILGIEYGEYDYEAVGPCVLIAQKPKATQLIFDDISHGGDASPYEVIPIEGPADPSWKYVLINTCGALQSIIMFPRGEKITERIPDLLMNYDGIKSIPKKLYQDIVATCARACREPKSNRQEMINFARRNPEL